MAKSKLISRIGALALAAALACTSLISASAATIDKATIDMDAKAQLSIYKYDFTKHFIYFCVIQIGRAHV